MSSQRWGAKLTEKAKAAGSAVSHKAKDAKDSLTKKHTTKDASFNEQLKIFDEEKKLISGLSHGVTSFLSGAEAILNAQRTLAEDLLKISPDGSSMQALCKAQITTCDQMIQAKQSVLDHQLNQTFTNPVNLYMAQYRELTDRIRERNRRESDMDKLISQREIYKQKNDVRLAATETRLASAQVAYEDLNTELIGDIPKLIADSSNFFQPLILLLIMNQAKFWSTMSEHALALSQRVDTSLAVIPEINSVITPKSESAMVKKYASSSDPWSQDPIQQQQHSAYGLTPALNQPYSQPALPPPHSHLPALPPNQPNLPPLPPQQPNLPPLPPQSNLPPLPSHQPNLPNLPPHQPNLPNLPPHQPNLPNLPPHQPNLPNLPPHQPNLPNLPPHQPNLPNLPPHQPNLPNLPPHQPNLPSVSQHLPSQPAHNPFTYVPPSGYPSTSHLPTPQPPVPISPRPVPTVPSVPQLPKAKCLWDFTGQDSTELSFRKGDIITIVEQKGEWWRGEKNGVRGLLPANYVQLI